MVKNYASGMLLVIFISIFSMFLLSKGLQHVKTTLLDNYFSSRLDDSFNIYVQYNGNSLEILDKYRIVQTEDVDSLISRLEKAPKHPLLVSVIEKIKNKTKFCFKINRNLKICGFYTDPSRFYEAYAFMGSPENKDLFSILTSESIGWKIGHDVKGDDLVHSFIWLLVKGYLVHYTLVFYNTFVIVENLKGVGLYRLDINYKNIFDISLPNLRNIYLAECFVTSDNLVFRKYKLVKPLDVKSTFLTFSNSIARNLNKEVDTNIRRCLRLNDFNEVMKYVDINKIKAENKDFINLLARLKSIPELILLLISELNCMD